LCAGARALRDGTFFADLPSRRLTHPPPDVAFTDSERLIGDAAKNQARGREQPGNSQPAVA
jgi:hypothetical protein